MKDWVIALFVVLVVVAAALAGLMAFLIVRAKKKGAAEKFEEKPAEKEVEAGEKHAVQEELKTPSEQPAEEITETETLPSEDVGEDTEDSDDGEEAGELKMVEEDGKTRYIVIKYSKSFQAKLIQSEEETKQYYSQLKNCLLSYAGVKSRMSWKWETFRAGRKALAKLRLRGKTLSICFALDPAKYDETKYHVESLAEVAAYAETPCLYRIKNDRRLKYAKELIDVLMAENGLQAGLAEENRDYAAMYPYEKTDALIERKLIKMLTDEEAQRGTKFKPAEIRKSVTVQEADTLIGDEIAELLVERSGGVSDRTKTGIINIDTLSEYFADGETVTLDEVKKRVKGFAKVTYLKVLARGTLDKKLTVEADNFSLQAVKMIALTGGKVIKK